MGKRFKKILFRFLVLVALLLVCVIWFSPFKKWDNQNYRSVQYALTINAPVDSVFQFMGNSKLASSWSVYVDEIKTLNADQVPDGEKGSIRRCFAHPLKDGQQWDEVISIVEPNKRRQLIISNLVNFPLEADGLKTEQLYEKLSENETELTLTLFYNQDSPSVSDWFKTKLAGYEIKRIFKGNLENIKKIIETKHD